MTMNDNSKVTNANSNAHTPGLPRPTTHYQVPLSNWHYHLHFLGEEQWSGRARNQSWSERGGTLTLQEGEPEDSQVSVTKGACAYSMTSGLSAIPVASKFQTSSSVIQQFQQHHLLHERPRFGLFCKLRVMTEIQSPNRFLTKLHFSFLRKAWQSVSSSKYNQIVFHSIL